MAQAPADERSRRLAEALIQRIYPMDQVEVRLGELPAEWPPAATTPTGATVVGTVLRRRDGRAAGISAYLEGPTLGDIRDHYERVLGSHGWKRFEPQMPAGGMGFRGTVPGFEGVRVLCRTEQDPFFSVHPLSGQGGSGLVTWDAGLDHHPMRQQGWHGPGGPMARLIPDLPAPPNVPVQGGGGGGSDSEWEIRARAHTSVSAADLARHYRDALQRAGWTLRDEGGADVVAWSRWKLSEDDYEGMLVVAEALAELRDLSLIIRSPSRASRGWRGWVSTAASRLQG